MAKNKKKQKDVKDAKYEFANDQLGENTEPRYEEMKQDKKGGKKQARSNVQLTGKICIVCRKNCKQAELKYFSLLLPGTACLLSFFFTLPFKFLSIYASIDYKKKSKRWLTLMSKVALIRCESYDYDAVKSAVKRGLTLLRPSPVCRSNEKILLKPNLLSADPPERCSTTHPSVFKAVAEIFMEQE